ncbi:cytochrome P450 10-like [Lingula anatina]|uniref:Cytochrome P450 10-like n=1 Tax=Lingula anatina TaxID=7574 RepID=A0A1S3I8R8_LINAN|nr:cytochrome P450 10-like [Lingula anatina]|eukprot:XP_013393784.1 cytochrome P450 10-like [Lingula anatina]
MSVFRKQRSLLKVTGSQCPVKSSSEAVSKSNPATDKRTDNLSGEKCPLFMFLSRKSPDETKPFSDIPGPTGLPLVGTLFDYFKKDWFGFEKMFKAQEKRAQMYGPIFREKIATNENVIITDPWEYQKVIRVDGKRPQRIELLPAAHYRKKKGISLGLVNSQGEEWHQMRTIMSKKILPPREVLAYCQDMSMVAQDFAEHLNRVKDKETGEVENLEHEIFKWALESIGTVLFERRIGCLSTSPPKDALDFLKNLQGAFKTMQPLLFNLPIYKVYPTKLWRQFEHFSDKVLELGQQFVNMKIKDMKDHAGDETDRQETPHQSALLTYLLSQASLTPAEANAHVIDLLNAAVETVSNSTIFALYCLACNPLVQEKLYQELSDVLPGSEEIGAETLQQLPYLKACVKETFRLFPITFATSRFLPKDVEVAGYLIPKGAHVQASLYPMGRDAKIFKDPEEYRPERWLRAVPRDPVVMAIPSLQFGHGSRMCIGRRLAEQEIYIVLTKIVKTFKLEYHHEPVEPVLNTLMTPDRPVKITFVSRADSLTI